METWRKSLYKGIIFVVVGILGSCVFIFGFTPYNEFDAMIRVVPNLFFIGIGFKDIFYALNHKGDTFFYFRSGLFLNNVILKKLVDESIFEGDGTLENPYRIADFSNLPSRIMLGKVRSYVTLDGLNLKRLFLKKCENIFINSNRIIMLRMNSCSNISVVSNTINTLYVKNCVGNIFQANEVSKLGLKELDSCQLRPRPISYVKDLFQLILYTAILIVVGYNFLLMQLYFIFVFLVMPFPILGIILPYRSIKIRYAYNQSITERPNIVIDNYSSLSV
ncbi:MAG: hypothetical protein ACXADW_16745 [Candidatus Hodarchaeales archaeon]|jgi:hypothetical protein